MDITALYPSEPLKTLPERVKACLHVGIGFGLAYQHCNASHSLALLRARSERPRRRAAEQRDERAAFHSITSSARPSSVGGTERPSALAVLRLMRSSYLVGC